MQILIQVWAGAWDSEFLTVSQVKPMLLARDPTLSSKVLKTFQGVYPSSVLSKLSHLKRRWQPLLHLPDPVSFQSPFCISKLPTGPFRGLSMSPNGIILMSGHQKSGNLTQARPLLNPKVCKAALCVLCFFCLYVFLFFFLQLLPSLKMFAPLLVTE